MLAPWHVVGIYTARTYSTLNVVAAAGTFRRAKGGGGGWVVVVATVSMPSLLACFWLLGRRPAAG